MAGPMDNATYNNVVPQGNIVQVYQNAMRNPKQFEEYVKRTNPQVYERAMQLANVQNPQQAVLQILRSRGMTPGMFNLPGFN